MFRFKTNWNRLCLFLTIPSNSEKNQQTQKQKCQRCLLLLWVLTLTVPRPQLHRSKIHTWFQPEVCAEPYSYYFCLYLPHNISNQISWFYFSKSKQASRCSGKITTHKLQQMKYTLSAQAVLFIICTHTNMLFSKLTPGCDTRQFLFFFTFHTDSFMSDHIVLLLTLSAGTGS